MCNLDRVSGYLATANGLLVATLVLLTGAVLAASNPFTSAANIPVMIAATATTAAAGVLFAAAMVELGSCPEVPCGQELALLRRNLAIVIAAMAVFTIAIGVCALVAAIPFAGAVAVGAVAVALVNIIALATPVFEIDFVNAIQRFDQCRERNRLSTIHGIVIVFAAIVVVAVLAFAVANVASGNWFFIFQGTPVRG
jgi:hypothetical protein